MTQTLLVVVLFVGAMALLPWAVRRLQQRQSSGALAAGGASRVVSAVAVGPQQRVVVTAQQVSCLHVLPVAGKAAEDARGASLPASPSFAQEMRVASADVGKSTHV